MIKVAIETVGCKLNQAESESISRQLTEAGYILVPSGEPADVYILNTCTVTGTADSKCRHLLRQAHTLNPDALVIPVGCYATRAPEELLNLDGISGVISNTDKGKILSILKETLIEPISSKISGQSNLSGLRTRSFIKIQDGCHNKCAYCIVPAVRPDEASIPCAEILTQVKQRQDEGYREIVLTGTEVGAYHSDGINLSSLLSQLLENTTIERIRLSSLQPNEITEELIRLWENKRLCPHFHISLQSGSDSVLSRMRRKYSTQGFRKALDLIRSALPEAGITTDIIVGFPGENETEFNESVQFCRSAGFSRIHVFPFSPRPGTEAALLPDQVPGPVKKDRTGKMLAVSRESLQNFNTAFKDRLMPVLWETSKGRMWSGYTGNYIRIFAISENDLSNCILPARLVRARSDGMLAEIENQAHPELISAPVSSIE